MRWCPVRDCGSRCQDRQFVCTRHWRLMPEKVKFDIKALFNKYLQEEITLNQFMNTGHDVVSGQYEIEREGGHLVLFSCCRRCGAQTLLAHRDDGSGRVSLDEVHLGPLVVVGGIAVPAAGRGRQYTRFTEHFCVATVARGPV